MLTVIVSYTEMAKQAVGEHPVREDLNHVASAAEQAAHLAGQLLTFSKERQVVMRRVDLNAAVAHALDLLRPTLPYNVEVELEVEPGPLWVLADEAPLQQVVMNLCLNARDAMPGGGRLRVTTGTADAPPGPAGSAANGRWARLTVEDTGCGIDEAVKPRIFEPLFTTKERGSGLGLAVVQQIVEGFAGRVEVESAAGQGARFDIWLPLRAGSSTE